MPNKYKKTTVACYLGYVTQSIVVNLAPLFFVIFRQSFGFSYSFIAALLVSTFGVQMLIDALSVYFVSKAGYRKCAVLSQLFSAVGIALLGILPSLCNNRHAAVFVSVLFYSVGGALIEVVISPITDALPSEAKGASMALLHSFYSWGQVAVILITTLLLVIVGEERWFLIPFFWMLLPAFNIFMFLKVPIIEPETENGIRKAKVLLKNRRFILVIILMIAAGASEQIMAQWASLFCEKGLGVTKVVGDLFGPCLFAAFMGIGRTFYGIKGKNIDLKKSLVACSTLAIVCYLVTVFSGFPALSLAGCALCGLGVSLLWPGMISLSAESFTEAGPAMFALIALGGDIGCTLGPYLTGIVSDKVSASEAILKFGADHSMGADEISLKAGILAGIVFPVIMTVGTLFFKTEKYKIKNSEKTD